MTSSGNPYLTVRDLTVSFQGKGGEFHAVDRIGFELDRGEILALVGESGSGKSMTSLAVMRLLPQAARMSGRITIAGDDVASLPRRQMEDVRGARIGMVFQEPMTSLNPVLTIARQMTEGLIRHQIDTLGRLDEQPPRALLHDRVDAPFTHGFMCNACWTTATQSTD